MNGLYGNCTTQTYLRHALDPEKRNVSFKAVRYGRRRSLIFLTSFRNDSLVRPKDDSIPLRLNFRCVTPPSRCVHLSFFSCTDGRSQLALLIAVPFPFPDYHLPYPPLSLSVVSVADKTCPLRRPQPCTSALSRLRLVHAGRLCARTYSISQAWGRKRSMF